MNNKKFIYENYLTNQYSISEKVNASDLNSVRALLKKDCLDQANNFSDLIKEIEQKKGKVLDLGCGFGRFLYFLKKSGCKNVTGVDLSGEELAICKKLFPHYHFFKKDIFSFLKETKNKFDLIHMAFVLEHIPCNQLIDLLKLIHNHLAINGKIVIVVPNAGAYFNATATRYADLTHEMSCSEKNMNQAFSLAGYKTIEIRNFKPKSIWFIKSIRYFLLWIFEILIQLMGYQKHRIYTPSFIVIAKK